MARPTPLEIQDAMFGGGLRSYRLFSVILAALCLVVPLQVGGDGLVWTWNAWSGAEAFFLVPLGGAVLLAVLSWLEVVPGVALGAVAAAVSVGWMAASPEPFDGMFPPYGLSDDTRLLIARIAFPLLLAGLAGRRNLRRSVAARILVALGAAGVAVLFAVPFDDRILFSAAAIDPIAAGTGAAILVGIPIVLSGLAAAAALATLASSPRSHGGLHTLSGLLFHGIALLVAFGPVFVLAGLLVTGEAAATSYATFALPLRMAALYYLCLLWIGFGGGGAGYGARGVGPPSAGGGVPHDGREGGGARCGRLDASGVATVGGSFGRAGGLAGGSRRRTAAVSPGPPAALASHDRRGGAGRRAGRGAVGDCGPPGASVARSGEAAVGGGSGAGRADPRRARGPRCGGGVRAAPAPFVGSGASPAGGSCRSRCPQADPDRNARGGSGTRSRRPVRPDRRHVVGASGGPGHVGSPRVLAGGFPAVVASSRRIRAGKGGSGRPAVGRPRERPRGGNRAPFQRRPSPGRPAFPAGIRPGRRPIRFLAAAGRIPGQRLRSAAPARAGQHQRRGVPAPVGRDSQGNLRGPNPAVAPNRW